MSDFYQAIPIILSHEGGFVDDPKDPGGVTNYGISLRYLKSLGEISNNGCLIGDIDCDGDIDYKDIKGMTKEKAIEIYKTEWWDKYGYSNINDQGIATKIFDMAVNMGNYQAIKLVQRACNLNGGNALLPIIVDGILGKLTLKVINDLMSANLIVQLRQQCVWFYNDLINKNPSLQKYYNGWMKRANF